MIALGVDGSYFSLTTEQMRVVKSGSSTLFSLSCSVCDERFIYTQKKVTDLTEFSGQKYHVIVASDCKVRHFYHESCLEKYKANCIN